MPERETRIRIIPIPIAFSFSGFVICDEMSRVPTEKGSFSF
jgi:hypothetical protein